MGQTDNELADLVTTSVEVRLKQTHVIAGAKIKKYLGGARADVDLLVQEHWVCSDNTIEYMMPPTVPNVIVMMPAAEGVGIRFEPPVGSAGLLLIPKVSLEGWRVNGTADRPNELREYHLGNALFIPGFTHDQASTFEESGKLVIEGQMILLGAGATEKLTRDDRLRDVLDLIRTHTHEVSGTAAAASTALSPLTGMQTACDKVYGV